jgi:integrase
MRFATPEQANMLATKVPERYSALVLVAAYGGLRWGELANLRRRHVDAGRGTVRVVEQVVELRGKLTVGAPKSEAGRRTVMLPPSLRLVLREHLRRWAEPGPDGLVFPAPEGGFLRQSNFAAASGSRPPRRPGFRACASTTFATRRPPSPSSPAPPPRN